MRSQEVDLINIKTAYFIGIKGVGMTALAQVFRARGIKVSGSDTHEKFFTDEVLKKLKILVRERFRKTNIPKDVDLVVTSIAYLRKPTNASRQGRDALVKNTEVQEALKRRVPILTYPEALGLLFKESYGVAVCGTHGKSTTTAMLGVILEETGLDPTVIVGTRVNQWGSNARVSTEQRWVRPSSNRGGSDPPLFVVEADEYREAFLNYEPKGLIVMNIEYDHPDYFKTLSSYKNAFRKLVRKIPRDGFIVANWNDKHVREAVKTARCKVVKYPNVKTRTLARALAHNTFVPGSHNEENAMAAATVALELGVEPTAIKKALKNFRGTARRFEFKTPHPTPYTPARSEARRRRLNPIVIDDYAHHPTEIRATLKTARTLWPKREIWVVFQPHTFSRTEALLEDFAKSFGDADRVFILETYSSAREKRGEVGAKELAQETAKHHKNVQYFPTIFSTTKELVSALTAKPYTPARSEARRRRLNPIIITMGAGDVWQIAEMLTKITF